MPEENMNQEFRLKKNHRQNDKLFNWKNELKWINEWKA